MCHLWSFLDSLTFDDQGGWWCFFFVEFLGTDRYDCGYFTWGLCGVYCWAFGVLFDKAEED